MTEINVTISVEYSEAAGSSKELVAALQRGVALVVGQGLLGPSVESWTADVREVEHLAPAEPMNWTIQRMVGGQAAEGPVLHEFSRLNENLRASVTTAFVDLVAEGLMFHHRPTKRSFEVKSLEDYERRLPEMQKEEAHASNSNGSVREL